MVLTMHLGEALSSQQLFLFAHHFTLIHFTLTSLPLLKNCCYQLRILPRFALGRECGDTATIAALLTKVGCFASLY